MITSLVILDHILYCFTLWLQNFLHLFIFCAFKIFAYLLKNILCRQPSETAKDQEDVFKHQRE